MALVLLLPPTDIPPRHGVAAAFWRMATGGFRHSSPHVLKASLRGMLCVLALVAFTTFSASPAWADDDGGDDSGGTSAGTSSSAGPSSEAGGGFEPVEPELPVRPDTFISNELLALNPSPQALARAQALGLRVIERTTQPRLALRVIRFRLPPALDAQTARQVLAAQFPQTFELHHLYALAQAQGAAPCEGSLCEARAQVGWPVDNTRCGRQQIIGMVDTEVNANHPSLKGASLRIQRFVPAPQTSVGSDHGTAVATLLVGQSARLGNGLVPEAQLLAAAAFSQVNSGAVVADTMALVNSLDWLLSQRAEVIGLSLAGPYNRILEVATQRATERGALLFAAAGNGGPGAAPVYPAAFASVMGVTAIDRNSRIYRRAQPGVHVDFAAPGVALTLPGEADAAASRSGTSFAVPFLVAMASQTLKNQQITREQWRQGQQIKLEDLGAPGRDDVFGWGLPRLDGPCR